MLRNEGEEGGSQDPGIKSLMLSMERHLSSTARVSEKQAFEAQQLFYDAMEATTAKEQEKLIHRTLDLDPTNVDALLYAAQNSGLKGELEIEVLRKIVTLGEKNLGPKTFKGCAGAFWGFIETRPYMRAREMLAEKLRAAGRIDEAIAEWDGMLKLNPNDNQGMRYNLLPCYIMLKRLHEAGQLFAKYDGECPYNAVFSWGRVLERLLLEDFPEAKKALAVARKQNSHVEAYLKGNRKPPKRTPEAYAPGSKEEAVCFAESLSEAWKRHPAALKWLAEQKKK